MPCQNPEYLAKEARATHSSREALDREFSACTASPTSPLCSRQGHSPWPKESN